jgi:hypothetical protein
VPDPSVCRGTLGSRMFYTDDVIGCLVKGHSDVLCRNIDKQMTDNGFNGFIRLCVKCEMETFSVRNCYMAL